MDQKCIWLVDCASNDQLFTPSPLGPLADLAKDGGHVLGLVLLTNVINFGLFSWLFCERKGSAVTV